MKNDKKKLIIVLSVVISVVIIGVASFIVYSNTPEQRIIRQLNLGNRYLSDLEYESAIACFETVITIDPQIADAYSGLIDCYEGLMDPDGLMNVYSDAKDVLDEAGKDLITGKTIDVYETMISEATSEGNYSFAGELISYLDNIDADRAQSQLTELNNTMCSALGHLWVEATCTEPRLCTRCGATEGDAIGHTPTEADYWTPSICEVCGEELEPVLTPEFVSRGLESMEKGKSYRYVSESRNGEKLTADITIEKYVVVDNMKVWEGAKNSDKVWELQEKEGYEWRILSLSIDFSGVTTYSYSYGLWEDGYYILPTSDADHYISEDEKGIEHFTVNYLGEECECEMITDWGESGFYNMTATNADIDLSLAIAIHVPKGYYGSLLVLYDSRYSHDTIREGTDLVYDEKFLSKALYFHFD